MKFVCDKCRTKYSIADEKVRRKVLKIRCKNCANIIVVRDTSRRESSSASRRSSSAAQDADALEQAFDGAFGGPSLSGSLSGVGGVRSTGSAASVRRRRSSTGHRALATVARAAGPQLAGEPDVAEDELEPEETRVSSTMDMLAPPGAEDEWYLTVDGHQFGPMSFDELGSRVKRGEARGDDAYVWRDGFDEWLDVAKVPELRAFAPPPPPLPARSGVFPESDRDSPREAGVDPDSAVHLRPAAPPVPGSLDRAPATAGISRQTGPVVAVGRVIAQPIPPLMSASSPAPSPPAGVAPPPVGVAPPPASAPDPAAASALAPAAVSPLLGVPAPLEAGIRHLPASYGDRPDMALSPGLLPMAPVSPRTPPLIKVAAITGILSTLTGVAILVYFLGFDRPPAHKPHRPTLQQLAMNTTETPKPALSKGPAASPDAGTVQLEFPPVDVEKTMGRRPRRPVGGRTKVAAKRPVKGGKKLTAAQRRLLDQMGGTKVGATAVPRARAAGRKARRPGRSISGSEVVALQRRNKFALKACYQRSLKRDDSLREIKAKIRVTVGASGKVLSVSVGGVSDVPLRTCLRRSIKRWFFKRLGGRRSQTIEFPLIFRGA